MKFTLIRRSKVRKELGGDEVQRGFRLALDRFAGRIRDIRVTVDDLNGPKGGIDTRCTVVAALEPSGTVTVHADGVDAPQAASVAADKLKRLVAKVLERRRGRSQGHRRKLRLALREG
ncbi:MAG: hypothetical protein IT290_08405 [Deltaproteobacteria bacterium]|nr:hypothetical protein [Deltaproteobacteria bacterium]